MSAVITGQRASSQRELLFPSALVTAAETLVGPSPDGTIDGVVAARALGHYWEGLRQYLAIRIGDEAAIDLLEALDPSTESLLAPPGPRARLFKETRALLSEADITRITTSRVWWEGRDDARNQRLRAMRGALDPTERELLELHHTRALSVDEIAFVFEWPTDRTAAALESARVRAVAILLEAGATRSAIGDHLSEAFALRLSPRPQETGLTLATGELVGERYEIEAHLGAGAFADVYRARDREVPDHVVALKIRRLAAKDEGSRTVARRELHLIASVFHPSIVQLKDHGWHTGRLWFVMPYYRGETLADRARREPLSRAEAATIFHELAHALATMHRAGVRHQDIKPENIFLARLDTDEERSRERVLPVFLDLGVAVKDAEAVLAGTPGYFAPEVAARFAGVPDPPPLSERSDVFALALALRYALEPTTMEGVVGGSVDAFIAKRARRAPSPPHAPELAYLAPWFERWLALNPDARPSAEELARDLSCLVRPEERRARRSALMRWAVPMVVAFSALTAAAVWTSSREAGIQRLEAERARQQAATERVIARSAEARAANIRNDLTAESARRQALQEEIDRISGEYQSSRLTREDLVERLAQTEGEMQLLDERHLETARAFDAVEADRDRLRELLTMQDARAEGFRAQIDDLEDREQQLRRRLGEAEREREVIDAEMAELRAGLAAFRLPTVRVNPVSGAM